MQRSASQRGRPDRLVGQAKIACRQQRAVHEKGRVRLVRRNRPVCFAFQEVSFLKGLLKAPTKSDYFLPAFLRLVFLLVDFLAFLRVAFFLVLFLAFLRVAFFLVLFLAFLRAAFFLVLFLAFLRVAFFLVLFLAFLRVAFFFFLTIALWLLPRLRPGWVTIPSSGAIKEEENQSRTSI
jgi:hypothetical protein